MTLDLFPQKIWKKKKTRKNFVDELEMAYVLLCNIKFRKNSNLIISSYFFILLIYHSIFYLIFLLHLSMFIFFFFFFLNGCYKVCIRDCSVAADSVEPLFTTTCPFPNAYTYPQKKNIFFYIFHLRYTTNRGHQEREVHSDCCDVLQHI